MTTPYSRFAERVKDAYTELQNSESSEQRAILLGREVAATMRDIHKRGERATTSFRCIDDDGRRFVVAVRRDGP